MHEYRQLVEREMSRYEQFKGHGGRTRLAEAAGLSRQVISHILRDDRERLIQVPEEKTINGLAKALRVDPEVIWTSVALALGLPSYVVPSITHEVRTVPDEVLLGELANRLGLAATFRPAEPTTTEGQEGDEGDSGGTVTQLNPKPGADDGGAARQQPAARSGQSKGRRDAKADLDEMTRGDDEGPPVDA